MIVNLRDCTPWPDLDCLQKYFREHYNYGWDYYHLTTIVTKEKGNEVFVQIDDDRSAQNKTLIPQMVRIVLNEHPVCESLTHMRIRRVMQFEVYVLRGYFVAWAGYGVDLGRFSLISEVRGD